MSRFAKTAEIWDRDTSTPLRGIFSLEKRRFIPPYRFFRKGNVSRFVKMAEISNRDTSVAGYFVPELVQGLLKTGLWLVQDSFWAGQIGSGLT